ncbi:MAG: PAS domain S-box protein [Gemmatimonadales bacterium]
MTPDSSGATQLRLRAAVESSPSGLLMTDGRGAIVLVNREIERLFGYSREELLGKSVDTLVPERYRGGHGGFRAGFLTDPRVRSMGAGRDLFGLRKDGAEVPVEIGLTPVATDEGIFVLASVVDISARKRAEVEQRRLEGELLQSQKLEAVGTLAGGIAHDFNNILGAIVGYAELAGMATDREAASGRLRDLLAAAARGKDLVERILVFSRRQEQSRQPIALGAAVADATKLLRAMLPASIEMRVTIHPDSPQILGDATSIHQIVMNLGTNAAHAMPEGGVLEIGVESLYLRDSMARAHPDLHEGLHGILTVRDHGHGMDRAIRDRAFEPFFTTKPPGSGTGLGLSMVHTIVRGHGGAIDLASEAGAGTTVKCLFPALVASPAQERATLGEPPMGRGQRVLFVEDDKMLAEMGEARLHSLGYVVTTETSSEHALETFRARPAEFDIVVTDYLMPRMVGLDLARAVHGIRPDIPIVMMTGFIEELPEETIRSAGVRKMLTKPATILQLGEVLHGLLHK